MVFALVASVVGLAGCDRSTNAPSTLVEPPFDGGEAARAAASLDPGATVGPPPPSLTPLVEPTTAPEATVALGGDGGARQSRGWGQGLWSQTATKDLVIGVWESTSWSDHGLKAFIVNQGETFACAARVCRRFSLTSAEWTDLVDTFDANGFRTLEDSHDGGLYDGSTVVVIAADRTHSHSVSTYGGGDAGFGAVWQKLRTVIGEHRDGSSIVLSDVRTSLSSRVAAWRGGARASAVTKWLADPFFLPLAAPHNEW
jgi:hypothetical protein